MNNVPIVVQTAKLAYSFVFWSRNPPFSSCKMVISFLMLALHEVSKGGRMRAYRLYKFEVAHTITRLL